MAALKSGHKEPGHQAAKKISLLAKPMAGTGGDMSQRMMWAEEAMKNVDLHKKAVAQPPQMHVAKSGVQQLALPVKGPSVWYNIVSNGDNAQANLLQCSSDDCAASLHYACFAGAGWRLRGGCWFRSVAALTLLRLAAGVDVRRWRRQSSRRPRARGLLEGSVSCHLPFSHPASRSGPLPKPQHL